MERAHQQIHRDYSAQRRDIPRGRAQHILRAAAKNTRKQRHYCENGIVRLQAVAVLARRANTAAINEIDRQRLSARTISRRRAGLQ